MLKGNKKLLIVNLAILMMLFFAWPNNALAAAGGYQDNENANGNDFSASSLDAEVDSTQSGLEPGATAGSMVPGTSVSRDANIENVGDEDFQYKVEFEKVSGSDSLCDALHVQAEKNGAVVYNNDLLDFTISGGTLNSGNDDDWDFTITMPLGTSHNVEGLDCDFNFQFVAWQTVFVAPTGGWIDEEEITDNEITAGDWEPIISSVENTDTLDTKGATNSEMSKVSISWSTDENTTSNVIYDTVSHATCVGYTLASPAPADVTADSTDHEVTISNLSAGTTYYYRAVSEDSSGHEVCSNQYSFSIPASSADAPTNDIVLNEFVPNPFGVDSNNKPNGEWVELYNKSGSDVGVNGWYIYDSTDSNGVQITNANTDTGDTTVPANGWLVVYLNKAYLNNDGDTVQLYSDVISSGILIDSHAYTGAVSEGKSFARFPDGVGVWIDPDVTPGKENQLKEEELKQFRELTLAECFDAKGNIKKSKNSICQKEFLEFIGMLDNKKDKKLSSAMQNLIKQKEEIKESEETKEKEEIKNNEETKPVENNPVVQEKPIQKEIEDKTEEIEIKNTEIEENNEEEKLPEVVEKPKEEVSNDKKDEKLSEEEPKEEPKEKEEVKKEEIKEENIEKEKEPEKNETT